MARLPRLLPGREPAFHAGEEFFGVDRLCDVVSGPRGEALVPVGRPLLEAYPALAGGLYDRAVQVMATGEPQYISGEVISTSVGDATVAPKLEVRIARLYDGVVIAWRCADEVERLGALLQQAQRLGRIGGWEENLLTGDVHWTAPTLRARGRHPWGRAVPQHPGG